MFLDDDIIVDPGFVAAHLAAHENERDGSPVLGAGRLITQMPARADWLMREFEREWNRWSETLDARRRPAAVDCYGGNLSVRTDALRESRGFDVEFGRSEDIEFAARLVEGGARPVFVPGENRHMERKRGPRILADSRANGRTAPALVGRHPWLLDETALGSFVAWGQRHMLGRRIAFARRLRPESLVRLASLLGHGRQGRSAMLLLLEMAYWDGVRQAVTADDFGRMTDGVAILMYHAFAPARSRASRYVVPVDRFEAQLRSLLRRGHQPLSLSAYLAHRRDHTFPPPRSFVVTIDDGYSDVEELAAPVLRRLGVPATIFVVQGAIGGRNDWDREGPLAGRRILDAAALERLEGAGFELGVHSTTHRPLSGCSEAALAEEIAMASRRLTERFDRVVPAFAYPYGVADPAARATVGSAGLIGLGIDEGLACPASYRDYLPRIEVHGTDSPRRIALAARIGGTRGLLPVRARPPQPASRLGTSPSAPSLPSPTPAQRSPDT